MYEAILYFGLGVAGIYLMAVVIFKIADTIKFHKQKKRDRLSNFTKNLANHVMDAGDGV